MKAFFSRNNSCFYIFLKFSTATLSTKRQKVASCGSTTLSCFPRATMSGQHNRSRRELSLPLRWGSDIRKLKGLLPLVSCKWRQWNGARGLFGAGRPNFLAVAEESKRLEATLLLPRSRSWTRGCLLFNLISRVISCRDAYPVVGSRTDVVVCCARALESPKDITVNLYCP